MTKPDNIQWRALGTTARQTPFSAQADTEKDVRRLAAKSADEVEFHTIERCRLTYGDGHLPHLPTWHVEESRPFMEVVA